MLTSLLDKKPRPSIKSLWQR